MQRWTRLFALAALSAFIAAGACSSFNAASDERGADSGIADAAADAADGASSPADAGQDAEAGPRCHSTAPFGTPTPLPGINTTEDETDGVLTDDELTVFFSVETGPTPGIFRATRATTADAFGAPITMFTAFGFARSRPSISGDARTLFFGVVDAPGGLGSYDIAFATRPDAFSAFGNAALVMNVSSSTIDGDPWITRDGSALWLASTRLGDAGASAFDLFRAARLADGGFETPTLIDVGGTHTEVKPVTTSDEGFLFFSSQRASSDDIWVAERTDGGTYGPPVRIDELDTPGFDRPAWVSADGCELVFASDRDGGVGGKDLYVARRAAVP